MELVYPTLHHYHSCMPPWTPEHHCRLTEQEILPQSHMGTRYVSPSAHPQPLGITLHRPLGHTSELPLPSVLLKMGSRMRIPGRCIPYHMGYTGTLCLLSLLPSVQSTPQEPRGQSQNHAYSSNMATPDLVYLPHLHDSMPSNHSVSNSVTSFTG